MMAYDASGVEIVIGARVKVVIHLGGEDTPAEGQVTDLTDYRVRIQGEGWVVYRKPRELKVIRAIPVLPPYSAPKAPPRPNRPRLWA